MSQGRTTHQATSANTAVELRPLLAFAVSVALWTVPEVVRYFAGGATLRQLSFDSLSAVAASGLSVAFISYVYRQLVRRGVALTRACALATAAALPVMMLIWLSSFLMTSADPTLSSYPVEDVSLPSAVLLSLADSIGLAAFPAATVFLPLLAAAHEQRRSQLELVVRDTEILRYRAQLEPHFVLNALNAVSGLVEEDPLQARELLAALGDLFRDANALQATHRVRDEMTWLERYLTIHQIRYPDKLRVAWDVAPETRGLMMPALLLQPLVENAVKHGALRGGGHLTIRSRLTGDALELVIEDDGPTLGRPREGGQGLSLVQRRVELEGSERASFALTREDSLTVARVRLRVTREGVEHG